VVAAAVALEVPAAGCGWLSNELSCLPGSLLAMWLDMGRLVAIRPDEVVVCRWLFEV